MPTPTEEGAALAGVAADDVVRVHTSPDGLAVVTRKGHAVTDPGDALPVAVQRRPTEWQARGDADPVSEEDAK